MRLQATHRNALGMNQLLQNKGLMLKTGTAVDATLISAWRF
jgi:hypothetical protein